jgi:excinuclease ABC subunit C
LQLLHGFQIADYQITRFPISLWRESTLKLRLSPSRRDNQSQLWTVELSLAKWGYAFPTFGELLLTHSNPFSPEHPSDFFLQFPAGPAVFVLRGAHPSAEPYAGKTGNLRKRLQRLLSPPESQSRRLNLRHRVKQIEYTLTGSDFESVLLLYKTLRREFPRNYEKRLRLRPAPLVRMNLDNNYPRAYVTTRIGRLTGRSAYYGPFRSRVAAEKFLNDSLDLFKMRRCTFELNPDPKFPGCVYSEMKMCLAPCFKGCTDEAYATEVARVQAFLDSCGESLIQELTTERDRLSGDLDFEAAAQQHGKIEKVKSIVSGANEIYQRLERLDAVIVQPSLEPKSVALFRFTKGEIAGPEHFPIEGEDPSQTLETRLRLALEKLEGKGAGSARQFMEELAILKRWYYRSYKVGEIVFAKEDGRFPMRKLGNAVGRVYRGEKGAPVGSEIGEHSQDKIPS